MIRKYKKHFREKERVKQGNGVSLPRSNQIVNRTISDFVVRFFLTDEDSADMGAYWVLSGNIL
jgi:hypothetical protein